jgi:hypothetical protein
MKSQNLIVVALTIALVLTAATLFVSRMPPDNPAIGIVAPAAISELRSATPPDDADLQTARGPLVAADPGTAARRLVTLPPNSRRIGCNNGLTAVFDKDGKSQGYTCNPTPYEDYDTEALEVLAYGDAEAASVLAYRLRDTNYQRAIRMARRSAALSGGDVSTLISATYWRPMEDDSGALDLSGIGQAYVLRSLIQKIRDIDNGVPPAYENLIRERSGDPEAVMGKLNEIAQRMYEEVLQIELDVTGSSTIGGDDDA